MSRMPMLYAPAMNKGEALRKVFLALQGNRSQKEIAEKAGLREPKVSLYANAKQFPRDANRRKLAIGLGCESLEQLDRAINLVELRRELGEDPEKLKALIGLFEEGADPEKAAAAALENIEDPKLAGILREMSRHIDDAMKAGDTMVSVVEGLSSLRRNLIFHWSRASSPEG